MENERKEGQNINNIINSGVNNNNLDTKIFIIICFHNELFKKGVSLKATKSNDIDKIELEYILESGLENYKPKVYSINFKKNVKRHSYLYLSISFDSSVYWELEELYIKDKKRFVLGDLKIIEKKIPLFMNYLNDTLKLNNIFRRNYLFNLNFEDRLYIYKNYIDSIKENDAQVNFFDYNENLAFDFITIFKKSNLNLLRFSNAANLFILSYKNQNIYSFLLLSANLIYTKDKIKNDKFLELVNLYKKKHSDLYKLILNNNDYEKYIKLMKDFMITYFLFYDKEIIANDIKLSLYSEKLLIKIINERDNITQSTITLNEYLDLLYLIYQEKQKKKKNKNEINRIQIQNIKNINNINFKDFEENYLKTVEYQKKKGENFIDFSYIIKKFIPIYNNLPNLKKLFLTFKYELSQKYNYEIRNILNLKIDDLGNKLFQNNQLKNKDILDFISYDEIYLSNKINNDNLSDEFIEMYNNDYKKRKKVTILKGVDINSNSSPNLRLIEEYKTYKYFYLDMCSDYIDIFTDKIKDIKNLGIFFVVLPKDYYNYDSIIELRVWIHNNINTFSQKECITFKEEINIFIEILIKFAKELVTKFCSFLFENLGEYCIELFIYLLNNNNKLTPQIKKELTLYYIPKTMNFDEYEGENIDNLIYFINHLKIEDNNIIRIFLDEIITLVFNYNEFISIKKSSRFTIFETLLSHKKNFILNKTGGYIKVITYICEDLIKRLKNLDLIYFELKPIYEKSSKDFLKRIKLLLFFLSKDEVIGDDINKEASLIFTNFEKGFLFVKNNAEELGKIRQYLDNFFSKNKEKNRLKNEIIKFINEILQKKLSETTSSEEIKKKINQFLELKEDCKKNMDMKKNSLLFNEIYNANSKKIQDEVNLLNETCKNFSLAIKIINEDPNKIQNNEYITYFYEIGYKNEDNLEKEINWLIGTQSIEITEAKKEDLLNALKFLIKKQRIINIINGILILKGIYESGNEIISTSKEQKYFNILENHLKRLSQNIPSKQIEGIINFIKGKFNKISFDNKDQDFNIILLFFNTFINKEIFLFLKEKEISKLENLRQFYLDSDEKELKLFEIEQFLTVIRFLNEDISKIKTTFELIEAFISGLFNKEKFGFYLNVVNKYHQIKQLFEKYFKGESGIFSKVKDIINSSKFYFSLTSKSYIILGEYVKENKNNKNLIKILINSDELDELYQRVFISIKKENNDAYLKRFISFYKAIKNLNLLINKLYLIYGYPKIINIDFIIEKMEMRCIYESNYYNYHDLINLFKNIKKNCKKILLQKRSQSNEIRLFYGRQLYLINNCLQNKEYYKIKDLISCVTNGLIINFNDNFKLDDNLNNDIYENMINNIIKYIKEQLSYNGKRIEDIYSINKIIVNENNFYKGFYFYASCLDEYDIVLIYDSLTGRKPANSNMLFCNKDTTLEEINTFISKAIFCTINSLFMIAIPEYLNNTQKSYLINILCKKGQKEGKMMVSCLLIFFSLKDSEFHQSILKLKEIKSINFDINYSDKKLDDINVQIINSKVCGLGKSTYIFNQKDKDSKLIYLPIGGEMTKEDLIERINIAIQDTSNNGNSKYILHIDLTKTKDIDLVKDFFFKLVFLKKFEVNENIIYIRPNDLAYIELENSFSSFLNTYIILNLLPEKKIHNLPEIKLTRELKIVSTILDLYEKNEIQYKKINFDKDCINNEIESRKIILKYLDIEEPNLYQINTFVNVLCCEFEKFNSCFSFYPSTLKENAQAVGMTPQEALNVRKLIIGYLIKITKHFTVGPYEKLIKLQNFSDFNDNSFINQSLKIKIDSITYDDIKPSLVVFNNDGNSVMFLTTCSENQEEFKVLEKLYNTQNIVYKKLKNLKSLNDKEIFSMLLRFLDVKGLSEEELKNIVGNYVYTTDNFIKVILILLRIRAKIPVIMMGETGCGKTTLIEMAFKLINKKNIEIKKLNIHSGTTDKDIIKFIQNLEKEVEEEDKILLNNKVKDFYDIPQKKRNLFRSDTEILEKKKQEVKNRQIWVFFDEINTCNSLGLLSEILCKKTLRNNPINERFVFIAACNPYRPLLKKRKMDSVLVHKKAPTNNLVYTVNPLPYSLLNFVFNFGNLKVEDEKQYIKSMVKLSTISLFKNYKNNNEEKLLCDQLIDMQIECISFSQNYVKENNDISVVSLREVNRFILFFKFFVNFIEKRSKEDENFNSKGFKILADEISLFYQNKPNIFIYQSAINLSLFICYYLRLPDKETRKEYVEKIDPQNKFFNGDFLKIPSLEMDYVINSFIIPIGIAKNQALKENLFSSLYCIINKIPLIICGKPGRSKTLCIQILESCMKGKEGSKSFLCKSFPELIIKKIQGSLNTKTEDIVEVFKKAREMQKEENNKEKLFLVLMDEMGLAELSINNPLKVTHFELENEKDKIPFIGITNWALDASKMNRVIYIIVQEPDENDLIITAEEVVKSYELNKENYYEKYGTFFKYLSKAYFRFIEDKKIKNDENKFFHGSRDFYSLIKNVMSDIIKSQNILKGNNDDEILYKICMKNIERNFGGLENSINEFKSYFNELYNQEKKLENLKEYELLECIKENLYDKDSRYLLMISDSSISKDILNCMINEINNKIIENKNEEINNFEEKKTKILKTKKVVTFVGSKFKLDEKDNYYYDEILYKIKCQMETENILILKDLEIIYPSLYELFNKSFINLQGTNFAKLGKSRSLSLVNDNFKVIVLVDKKNISNEDPPFLNRFEKHIISFTNILNSKLIALSDEIYSTLKEIISFDFSMNPNDSNNKNQITKLNKNIRFISKEEVRGLIYNASKKKIIEKNEIIKFILSKISPTFTEDLMIIIQKFGFKAKYNFYYENIMKYYKDNYRYNLKNFIEKTKDKFSIIYTFSFINDILFDNNESIKNGFFNETINRKSIKEIKISDINSINIIEKSIINFMTENKYNLFLVRFREKDLTKLENIHNIINDYKEKHFLSNNNEEEKNKNAKLFIILIHVSRTNDFNIKNKENYFENNNSNFISFLSYTPQYFIDNINNKYSNFLELLSSSNEEIIHKLIVENSLINKSINNECLRLFKYNIINKKILIKSENNIINNNLEIRNENDYKNKLVYKIVMDIKELIIKGIISLLKNNDLLKSVFFNDIISKEDSDFLDTLIIYLKQQILINMIKLIYLFDQQQILSSLIANKDLMKYDLIKEKINNYIQNISNINTNKINFNGINLIYKIETKLLFGIRIPFIQKIINDNIFNFIKNNISKKYLEKETIIMNKRISNENLRIEKDKYLEKIKELNNFLKNELINFPFIENILNSGNKNLIKDLFSDCFHIFLMRKNTFNSDYDSLIQLLDILIQIRLKTRLNDDLNIDFCSDEKEEIEILPSFLDLFNDKKDNDNNIINKDINDDKASFYLDLFVNVLNFIESYSKEIYHLLELFNYMNKDMYKENTINYIKDFIIKKKVSMENSDRNPDYSQINKICFFYVMESLLVQIIDFLKNKTFFNIYQFINKIKCYITNLFKLEKKFLLFSKQLFIFEIIIKLFEYYEKEENKETSIYQYEILFKKIMEETQLLSSKKYEELNNNYILINNCLKSILGENSDKYSELMNSIILNRYKSIDNIINRENLLKLLIPDNPKFLNQNLIEKSYSLISLILGKPEPEQYIKGKEDSCKANFLSFASSKNDKYYTLKKILNQDYPGLTKLIIYYYEHCCKNYFDKILEKEGKNKENLYKKMCEGLSKDYLGLAIKFIKDFYHKKINNNNTYDILGKNFCIAYIKRYLDNYVNIIFNKGYQYLSERTDINKLLFLEETLINNEIKYYVLKLCLKKKNNNYKEFLKFMEEDKIFEFDKYFTKLDFKNSKIFFYDILPSFSLDKNDEDFKSYKDFYDKIEDNSQAIPKNLNKYDINDIIFTYLYFTLYKLYLNKNEEGKDFILVKANLFNMLGFEAFSEEDKFRSLIINQNSFKNILLQKIVNEDDKEKIIDKIEILFYAWRFVFSVLCKKNTKNFYYLLLTNNAAKTINENMIPGKLANINDFIKTFDIIKQNFNKDPTYNAYLCSCGYHYTIDNCSFPTIEFNCPKCNQIIGGKNHILHRREGHKRIFFNQYYKDFYLQFDFSDKNIPFILLKDLEAEVNKKKNELFKGLKKETKDYFLKKRTKIRGMSYITFRILNYILHGFIFYSNIQGYLSDEYLKNNLIDSMTCFEIMEKNWEIIDYELKIKQVPDVRIFMNIIFDKVIASMNKQKIFDTDSNLNNFENEIEKIISEQLTNQTSINKYIINNNIMTDNVEISDKLILLESSNINIDKKYPDMKYFKISKLPEIEDFRREFNSLEENVEYYPIINYLLEEKSKIKYLKYLPTINELCNNIINSYSYKLTREEARKIKIKEEMKASEELIDKFITYYQKLRPLINQYECHTFTDKNKRLYFNDLDNNQYLSNFCVDVGEFDYGMVLAAMYKEMINWQNQFINTVINSKNINHKNYSALFEQEIMIQDCQESDIIKLPHLKDVMNNIIIKNSYQKNYGVIHYNYNLIEDELASEILPSIKKFVSDNDTCLRYIVYQFEGFRGNKSNIMTIFIEKYRARELTDEELEIIMNYKNPFEKRESKKMTDFLFSLQILIDIILEKNYAKTELISKIIEQNNTNESLNILMDLFNDPLDNELFTVDSLINIYNIFELICWEKIKDNLEDYYLMELNNNIKQKIDSFFSKNENDHIITKQKLSTAIRRLISRYLAGKRGQKEIDENNLLFYYLSKQELWDEYGFVDNDEFGIELNAIFDNSENNSNVIIGQATKLYEYLGGDQFLLNKYFSKFQKKKQKKEKDESDDNNSDIIQDEKGNKKNNAYHEISYEYDNEDDNDDENVNDDEVEEIEYH